MRTYLLLGEYPIKAVIIGGIRMQTFYTVQPGDTLSGIARRWGTPLNSLIAASNVQNPDIIFIGQQLAMPPGIERYRVQAGDSLYRIAARYRVPLSVVIEANNLAAPYTIFPGQLLEVPPGVSYYVVQPGDSLFQIGLRYNVTTSGKVNTELIQLLNNLTSTTIFPGMTLEIPYAPLGEQEMLAYTAGDANGFDIWLYNAATGANHRLTNGLGESFSVPHWSPDRGRIAFVGKNNILYVINLGTGEIASIDQFPNEAGIFLNWSPDGEWLAYSKGSTITLYNITTHVAHQINQSGATDVQWFPNGRELIFQAHDSNGISQLYRIGVDGTGLRQLTANTEGNLNDVRLSPDGSKVLYTTPGASISIIRILDLSTGNTMEVPGGPLAKNHFPTWSPDSSSIAFSATAYEDRGYYSLIRLVTNQGGSEQTVAISNCFSSPVDWSPDQTKLAYLSGCSADAAAGEIWVTDLRHPAPRRLVTRNNIMAVQWAPTSNSTSKATFRNPTFRIQFQYPADWIHITPERFEGPEGFFQISALSSAGSLDDVCQSDAYHQLMPYGSNPTITRIQIQSQEACFIYPSDDQPQLMNNQASIIVRYPSPVEIGGNTYQFFVLWADKYQIEEIASTIQFL